jgi:capsular polysaccharide biosynthesis protein
MSAPTSPVTVRALVSVVRRRWRVFASCLVLTVVGFVLLGSSLPQRFESTAVVRVEPAGQVASSVKITDQLNMPTEVRAATSETVVDSAAQAEGSTWTPTALAASTRVINPQDSQLLEITVGSTDARQAALGADEIATAYLGQRAVVADEAVQAERAQLQDRIATLNRRIKKLDAPAGTLVSTADSAQIASLVNQVDQLEADLTELDLHAGPNGVLLDSAGVASSSSTPPLAIFVVAGVALGCAAGAAVATWRDRRDTSVQDGRRMAQVLNVPVVEADGNRPCGDLAADLVDQLAMHTRPEAGRTVAVVGDYADVVADAITAELKTRASTGWRVVPSVAPLLHGISLQLAQDSALVVVVSTRSRPTAPLSRFEELLTLRGGGITAGVLLPDIATAGATSAPASETSSSTTTRPMLEGATS